MTSLFYVYGYILNPSDSEFGDTVELLSDGAVFVNDDGDIVVRDKEIKPPIMVFPIMHPYSVVSIYGHWFVALSFAPALVDRATCETLGGEWEDNYVEEFDRFLHNNVGPSARGQRYIVKA